MNPIIAILELYILITIQLRINPDISSVIVASFLHGGAIKYLEVTA